MPAGAANRQEPVRVESITQIVQDGIADTSIWKGCIATRGVTADEVATQSRRQALLRFCRSTNVGAAPVFDRGAGDDDLVDVVGGRDLEHDRPEHVFDDRAKAAGAGLAQHREVGDRLERLVVEVELDAVELEHALVLLDERVLRLGQDLHERVLVERRDRTRRRAGGR